MLFGNRARELRTFYRQNLADLLKPDLYIAARDDCSNALADDARRLRFEFFPQPEAGKQIA